MNNRTDSKGLRPYRVTIQYREPTYEMVAGQKAEPYGWTFRVVARTDDEARDQAVMEFRMMEKLSGVGWTRDIVSSVVDPV